MAVVLANSSEVVVDRNHSDRVIKRRFAIRQDGQTTLLRTSTCAPHDRGGDARCGAPLPLQRATRYFDPSRPFRLTFSSTSRAE